MAKEVDITMFGDKRLARMLHKLPLVTQKKVVRTALRKAGKVVKEVLERTIAVDRGDLKATVKLKALKRSRGSFGVQVFATGPGLIAVEFGSADQPAQGSIRKSMESTREANIAMIKKDIGNGIITEARKIG